MTSGKAIGGEMVCEVCKRERRRAYHLRERLVCTNCVCNLAEWALYESGKDIPATLWAVEETRREAQHSQR